MSGSLNDILLEPISEENEKILLDHLKRKIKIAAELNVLLLHEMEERFGPEAREVVRTIPRKLKPKLPLDAGEPEVALHEFCAQLDKNCAGSHRWQRVIDEPGRVGYYFTRCMWAEVYRELCEPELGLILCAGDEPAARSYNSRLAFERTKTLMGGDELCNHIFYVEENLEAANHEQSDEFSR